MSPLPGWLALGRQGGVQALDGLNGAFRQYGSHGVFLHVDFGTFRDFQGQELVADFGHAANQTAADHDFIALGEAGDPPVKYAA